MSITLSSIATTMLSSGIKQTFSSIGSLAKDIRSALTGEPDPEKLIEVDKKLMELEFAAQKAQIDINLQESKHPSIFVAGWRPFIGWVCGTAIAYNFIGHPLILWVVRVYGLDIAPPIIDASTLMTLVLSLLGLGGMRTFEKTRKVNDRH